MEPEKKAPWWMLGVMIAIGISVIGQVILPDSPILLVEFVVIIIGLAVAAILQYGMGAVYVEAGIVIVIAALAACNAIATFGATFGATWPLPEAPSPRQVWQFETVGWPAGVYLFFITVGYITSWMSGAKGIVAAVITAAVSILGALVLGQPEAWVVSLTVGLIGSILAMAAKLVSKPAGAAPLITTVMALVFGLIYLFVTPLQAWVVLGLGVGDPIAGITAIAGYSAGAGIVSAISKVFSEMVEVG